MVNHCHFCAGDGVNRCLLCDTPAPYSWYCQRHYLEKEARYALYDIKHNRDDSHLMSMALTRLLALASYRQNTK